MRYTIAFLLASTTLAHADVPAVMTDIPPVHSLVSQVMQGVGKPELLIKGTSSPHGYALRPSEAAKLENSDLIFYASEALTPWLTHALEALSGDANVTELSEIAGTNTLPIRESAIFQDDHDDEHHSDHDGHDHDLHDIDPHTWLDPSNAKIWLQDISTTLAAHDPINAALYKKNATLAQDAIDETIATITATVSSADQPRFIVLHDAYQYFETRFDIPSIGAISASDAVDPSPRRLAELRKAATDRSAACVLIEPQQSRKQIDSVFGDMVKIAEVDPLGATQDVGPDLYRSLLVNMANTMSGCDGR